MEKLRWCSIDPGSPTGVAIFDQYGKHVITGTIKYLTAADYIDRMKKMRDFHSIAFALLESYTPFITGRKGVFRTRTSHKVSTQVQICKEIFPEHIFVNPKQWNPSSYSDKWKRAIVRSDYHIDMTNSHETDAFLMAMNIWKRVQMATGQRAFWALLALAMSDRKKYPRANDRAPWFDLLEQYHDDMEIVRNKVVNY